MEVDMNLRFGTLRLSPFPFTDHLIVCASVMADVASYNVIGMGISQEASAVALE